MSSLVVGGAAALLSSVCWALGAVLWRRLGDEISPLSMNLSKVVIGSIYLVAVIPFATTVAVDMRSAAYLGASGVIGIALGDSLFFISLVHLGPRLASLMGTLNPVLIALSAVVFLGERPTPAVWAGIIITTGGVAWVLRERASQTNIVKNKALGIQMGLLSIICTMASVLMAKIGVEAVPALQATLIRISCAAAALVLWGALRGNLREWVVPFRNARLLRNVCLVVAVVVFGGFFLSLAALKYIDASISGVLGSTAPLFILPMVVLLLKEKISARAGLGAAVAVGGVGLILAGALP